MEFTFVSPVTTVMATWAGNWSSYCHYYYITQLTMTMDPWIKPIESNQLNPTNCNVNPIAINATDSLNATNERKVTQCESVASLQEASSWQHCGDIGHLVTFRHGQGDQCLQSGSCPCPVASSCVQLSCLCLCDMGTSYKHKQIIWPARGQWN